jgi:hypothetical protein
MPSATLLPSQLLHYLPSHRVLICKECRYAIQPAAISRHLKTIHHIYRTDRQAIMEYVLTLDLADPGDVVPPEPHEAPVPFIPTESGLACNANGCSHLCITAKRMKSHWSTRHSDTDLDLDADQWRPVELQTFFRGNQLRYFAVCILSTVTPQSESNSELDSGNSNLETDTLESPSSVESDWSTEDLGLLEHFKTSTYLDVAQNPETRMLWRTAIPQLAFSHAFLMHGILACSALHLAHLNPSEKQRYNFASARHQGEALPAFRLAIADPNEDNCNALLAFSNLLIIHSFASEEQDEHLLLVGATQDSGMPDWLKIVRGSCAIFQRVWHVVVSGPFKPLVMHEIDEERLPDVSESPEYIRRLGLLISFPFPGEDQPETSKTHLAFATTLLQLSRAFRKADAAGPILTIRTAVYSWPAQVTQDYLDLLAERHPAALILLAHYCILLRPLESQWYMSGIRKRLITRIYRQLDEKSRHWLQWPLEEIGVSAPAI